MSIKLSSSVRRAMMDTVSGDLPNRLRQLADMLERGQIGVTQYSETVNTPNVDAMTIDGFEYRVGIGPEEVDVSFTYRGNLNYDPPTNPTTKQRRRKNSPYPTPPQGKGDSLPGWLSAGQGLSDQEADDERF